MNYKWLDVGKSVIIEVDKKAKLTCGDRAVLHPEVEICVRDNAECKIGSDVSIGKRSIIKCHNSVVIGDNVSLGPDVKIYDHDHDFKNHSIQGKEWRDSFLAGNIKIGSNVWIGANTMILRNTEIGDNCVIAAGTILKGKYPDNQIITQVRETRLYPLTYEKMFKRFLLWKK